MSGESKALAAAVALEQVSARFASRNRGAPLPSAVIDGHLPAALVSMLDGMWPAAYFLDTAAAYHIAPPGVASPAGGSSNLRAAVVASSRPAPLVIAASAAQQHAYPSVPGPSAAASHPPSIAVVTAPAPASARVQSVRDVPLKETVM